MTDATREEIIWLIERGYGVNEVAKKLGIYPNSVRWALNRGKLLERERQKRKDRGAQDYRCSVCGEAGHNRLSCGVKRE